MALNQTRRWLVAYDVRDPRRLKNVHQLLKKIAVPVQYSMFATRASTAAIRHLARAIEQRIDPRADDVRLYPIPERPLIATIGPTFLPEEIMLIDARADLTDLLHGPRRTAR